MFRLGWLGVMIGMLALVGCENTDFENPLDPRNVRTSGAPGEVTLAPANGQVTIRWVESGLEGIEAYRIYRRYVPPGVPVESDPSPGDLVAEVPATLQKGQVYEFVDDDQGQGLENDRGTYVYRLAYVSEGQTVPDPADPPPEWPFYAVIPSTPPPPLALGNPITLGEPKDLELDFFWADYQPPQDIAAFRVYVGPKGASPRELELAATIKVDPQFPNPTEWFFVDRFEADKVTRTYRIVAVDQVGVESDSPVFEATSPNLPPPAPPQTVGPPIQHPFSARYDIRIQWQASTRGGREIPDLVGYRIYSTHYDISHDQLIWRLRKTLPRNTFTYEFQAEDPIAYQGELYYRQYYVVAYDDTPREDGSEDESPLPPVPELVPPQQPQ